MLASDRGCKYRPEGHGEPDMIQPEALIREPVTRVVLLALNSALAMTLLAIAQLMLLRRLLQSRVTNNRHVANRIFPVQFPVIVSWTRRRDPSVRVSFAAPRIPGGTNLAVVRE